MAPSSSSSSSSSSGGSHAGLAIAATAMALSGTLVLYSLCRANKQPQLVPSDSDAVPSPRLRPCLSSSEKRKKKKREMARRGSQQKRVRFADDVVDKDNNGAVAAAASAAAAPREEAEAEPSCAAALRTPMPANREALYRGMLRGRTMLRVACSY